MSTKLLALFFIIATGLLGYFVYQTEVTDSQYNFKLGLDLTGGSELVYEADVSNLPPEDVDEALLALQGVIERRINAFGVGEPVIRIEESVLGDEGRTYRLAVELPDVTDIEEAKNQIGQTPFLEFKRLDIGAAEEVEDEPETVSDTTDPVTSDVPKTEVTEEIDGQNLQIAAGYQSTGLDGGFIDGATVSFQGGSPGAPVSEPVVLLEFNKEGTDMFATLTAELIGQPLAIFLDGELISAPIVRDEITNGTAVISGNFSVDEAKELVRNLNLGALPVPITLAKTQIVGPTLGQATVNGGVTAGMVGFGIILLFLMAWYRVPGIVGAFGLVGYAVIMLSLFKVASITLTAAGVAGFLLSIGMAVDANIIVFERLKEELFKDRELGIKHSVRESFARAWPAVRDANLTSLIVSLILFLLGTSVVKGFALVFGLGVIVSMFSALVISRVYLLAIAPKSDRRHGWFIPFLAKSNQSSGGSDKTNPVND